MTLLLLIALGWLVMSSAIGLVLGRAIAIGERHRPRPETRRTRYHLAA